MTIRRATVDDIPQMRILWWMMIREVTADGQPNLDWREKYLLELMATDLYSAYVIDIGSGVLAGFADGMIHPDPVRGKLVGLGQSIFVIKGFRGLPVSWMLYRMIIREAKAKGAEVLELVCFDNARDRWQSKGYSEHKHCLTKRV